MKQANLHAGDIVVVLALSSAPGSQLSRLAGLAGRSIGECHNAIRRLRASGLVNVDRRSVEREPLIRFLDAGVRVAFPPTIGGETVGVATAFVSSARPDDPSAGPLAHDHPVAAEFVWPLAGAVTRGQALAPLHPRVALLASTNRELWNLLAMVDLIRVGGAREHREALERLRLELTRDRSDNG